MSMAALFTTFARCPFTPKAAANALQAGKPSCPSGSRGGPDHLWNRKVMGVKGATAADPISGWETGMSTLRAS